MRGALALGLLLICTTSIAVATGEGVTPRWDVMDPALQQALAQAGADGDQTSIFEVIYQFTDPVTDEQRKRMTLIGLEHLGDAPLINGGLVSGTMQQILALASEPMVLHLELNRLLEHFFLPGDPTNIGAMMHETVHVVNSSTSWHRAIVDAEGNIEFEDTFEFSEWDGDGTTAVDLDTGIDGEHPDFDCGEPWSGEKLIWSAKWSGTEWVDAVRCNSDTSSGHGTHVGGTIAGNGDASAGRRLGTAKGAQIVALGTGDGASIFAAQQGLEWVFENSRPGLNQYNIRVVSNSWGTDGDYDPGGSIAQLTERLTYENGVAVIFAASNSGGGGSESDGDLRTNVYANTPSAISVAALAHDGQSVTSFSSRGWKSQQHTWPDIGAPGRDIWATAPRGTAIDASTRTQGDIYYMAISGTSMATPHIGGIATVLISVAPSLGVADYQHEDHDAGISMVTGDTPQGIHLEDWVTNNNTRVHEVELILELTAKYDILKNSCEDGNDEDSCNDIPADSCYTSNTTGRCHDWRVGHGLVDVDRAVALARSVQLLRDPDGDGFIDHPEMTVWDAFEMDRYLAMLDEREIVLPTDQLKHSWKGEWSHFNNGPTSSFGSYSTDDKHYVWVPEGTTRMQVAFTSMDYDANTMQAAQIRPNVDLGSDGSDDAQGEGEQTGDTLYIDLAVSDSHWNTWTEFDVSGTAISLPITQVLSGSEFFEPRIPYTVDVLLTLDVSQPRLIDWELRLDGYTDLDPAEPSPDYDPSMNGNLVYVRPVYDQQAFLAWTAPVTLEAAASGAPWGIIGFSFLTTTLIAGAAWGVWNGMIPNPFVRVKLELVEKDAVSPAILEPENDEESMVESIS